MINKLLYFRPIAHLFGHVHDEHDIKIEGGVTFSNASMDMTPLSNVIDLYLDPKKHTLKQSGYRDGKKLSSKAKGDWKCTFA